MDMGGQEKFEEKRNEDPMNFSHGMTPDWRFGGSNLTNTSMGLVSQGISMTVSKGDLAGSSSSRPSAPVVDSFNPAVWDHPANSQDLGFCDMNAQTASSTSDTAGIRKGIPASLRSGLDMCWNPPNSMLKGEIFIPNGPGMLPQSLSQFPADSAFIERAARFSCFGGGNFSDMINPFGASESMSLYSRGDGPMVHWTQEVAANTDSKAVLGVQSHRNEINGGEDGSRDVSLPMDLGANQGSPLKDEKKSESLAKSHDEVKQAAGSGNESDEADFSGGAGQEEQSMLEATDIDPSSKGSKKRKRSGRANGLDQGNAQQLGEFAKDTIEIRQKGDQQLINKATGKQGKQGSQASDPPKEEYIHVRARRGQATNSHSLAERVRREKISERMKFLQDLVPGCSKVTGKAVMLDEIINYVQSLQRQVEFLSMKLATVNPRLDFNIEGLLAKDILQSRVGPSSSLGFSPEMPMAPYPQLHPSESGLIQAGLPAMGSSSDLLRRAMGSQMMPGGFKELPQLPNVWDDELHNVVQMSYGASTPPTSQDVDGTAPSGHMKVEL